MFEINGGYGGRCVIAGRMINWCLDDELWIHPGFLAPPAISMAPVMKAIMREGLGGCGMGGTIGTSAPLYS